MVQGEGRGHLTQAIALQQYLLSQGHELVACYVGKSPQRTIAPFFKKTITCPIRYFESPNFLKDKHQKGIQVSKTLAYHALKLPKHFWHALQLVKWINQDASQVVVSFYEPLLGFSQWFSRLHKPFVVLAHQFLVEHPDNGFPEGSSRKDIFAMQWLNRICRNGAIKVLALSLKPFPVKNGITVVPPLLRQEVLAQKAVSDDFYLVYLLNKGYAQDLINWHSQNLHVRLEVFWDDYSKPDEFQPQPGITFHHIQAERFVQLMSKCGALLSTAGYESICEAHFLGKPVMVIPVARHYEQFVNANEVERLSIGIWHHEMDVARCLQKLANTVIHEPNKAWLSQGAPAIMQHLQDAATSK